MDNKTDAKKPVGNQNNKTQTKTKPKDLSKIHRVVSHTGVKVITSIGMLLVIGACGYATYKFVELEYKGIPEYAGIAFMWIGVFVFSYFTVREIILKDDFFTLMAELYHYENALYYLFLLLGFAFFVTFAVMLWGNVTASAPLGMKYKRHCPLGTKHGNPEKHPSQLT
tara:strand:- start:38614 stop:39117 length:504 start_codon:yes stop_codon:yes gene_type:complete